MTDLFSPHGWDSHPPDPEPRKAHTGAVSPGHGSSPASITGDAKPVRRAPDTQPRKAASREYPAYFDTVPGVDLRHAEEQALTQDGRILKFFQTMGCPLTPSRVHRAVGGNSPLTSTRRSITGLERTGWLVKTDQTVPGPYGRPEHTWRLAAAEARRAA